MDDNISKLIQTLAETAAPNHARNPWDFSRAGNAVRRKNLLGYFSKMREISPKVLMVGEAPGYRGCGRTGVMFSSEKLMLQHPFFAEKTMFGVEDPSAAMAELSASIVWKTFDNLKFYPLMWATYPFHTHKPGDPASNRAPRPEEVLLGREFLKRVMDLFKIEKVVAVGRVAEHNLADLGIVATPIRHPSHGGAVLFASGLRNFVSSLNN